ncbi:MAG: PGPGW domain-containing protein [Syntrophobacteraceae bacterium]
MRRILKIITGIVLTLVGLTGVVLPILPGWVFLLAGISILSSEVPFLDRIMQKIRNRFPVFARIEQRLRNANNRM